MAFHSTYNDYLIHKTKQKSSLRNNILDPNLNLRQNLPLYINYQVSELRRKKSKVDYNCLHSNLAQKIEIITENSLLKEKTNFTKLDNFLPSASRKKLINIKTTPLHDDTTKGLYDKLCKKDNKSTNYIDKYFTFQTEDVISHKKIDTKEKIGLEKNLKMIMHDAISEKLLNNLFKKFSCLQLKKNISEEKKQNKLIEGEVDFENRFETLYKKLQINKKENEKTLNELCLLENMDMAKILDLPQGFFIII